MLTVAEVLLFNQFMIIESKKQMLVGWILLHINLCRLFNAKSIFMRTVRSTLNNSV